MGGWLIFAFLVATAALALVSKRLGIAYPIVFVIAGALLGFVPNLPRIELEPDLIFLIVLPVILFAAAWTTDLAEFRRNLRPIGLLAIGFIGFTTLMVAAIAHAVIAGITWPAAFTLGAIIAPTDAIAAESIAEGMSVPRRIVAIISGESLVNDASSLIIYRFAIAAAVSGTFVAASVIPQLFIVTLGGIAVGLVIGFAVNWVHHEIQRRELADDLLVNIINLFAPFAAYLPAEALGFSGVLSTVTCGMYLSRRSGVFSPDARLIASGIWEMLIYLLNAFVFLLLGLQLHGLIGSLGGAQLGRLAGYGVVISIAVVLLRFIWMYPATYIPRWLFRRIRERDAAPPWQWPFLLAWSGMRGIVSLAAALAVPLSVPSRNEIIFVTFAVIFATLVVMGLTLPVVIRMLGVHDDSRMDRKEIEIRIKALEHGLDRLRALEPTFDTEVEWEVEGRIMDEYRHRIEHLTGHLDSEAKGVAVGNAVDHRLQNEAFTAERQAIAEMRRSGAIPDEIYRHIERDLDLAEARLRAV